ncbi:hypothetical protein T484DRAFT_2026017 [Baffinella frigidus]|nr:hypothetical protein T484DRAFT_2026017 [Cryptophyta sp. CCMP2293]|mmetsp:Transcript_34224/g.81259  ORF Transcript_34224/g.81259 Transcript_34224/m.81259 type:complete len:191 (+) Transcript_34224:64-636(+)
MVATMDSAKPTKLAAEDAEPAKLAAEYAARCVTEEEGSDLSVDDLFTARSRRSSFGSACSSECSSGGGHVWWGVELEPVTRRPLFDQPTTRRGILKEPAMACRNTLLDHDAFCETRTKSLERRLGQQAMAPVSLRHRLVAGVMERVNRAVGSIRQLLPKRVLAGFKLRRTQSEGSAKSHMAWSARRSASM